MRRRCKMGIFQWLKLCNLIFTPHEVILHTSVHPEHLRCASRNLNRSCHRLTIDIDVHGGNHLCDSSLHDRHDPGPSCPDTYNPSVSGFDFGFDSLTSDWIWEGYRDRDGAGYRSYQTPSHILENGTLCLMLGNANASLSSICRQSLRIAWLAWSLSSCAMCLRVWRPGYSLVR